MVKRFAWPILMVGLLILTASTEVNAGGTVLQSQPMYSEALGAETHYGIYLPEGYDSSEERYPVIYFLHGDSYSYWIYWYMGIGNQLDYLIDNGIIDPVIMVTPDGYQEQPWNGTCWTNTEFYGDYEDLVVHDLVRHIDENYRTEANWRNRSIQGLSTGSHGAARLGLKHPDVFNGFAAHSGPLALEWTVEIAREHAMEEHPDGPPYDFDPFAGTFTNLLYKKAAEFSPNLENPLYYVDFILDRYGEVIESVMDRWRLEDAAHLASLLPMPWRPESPEIFFDCGTLDEYGGHPVSVAFANVLDGLGIPYTFESFEGGHADQFFTSRFGIGVTFLCQAMAAWQEVALDIKPGSCPNPFNANSEGVLPVAIAGSEDLNVYDIDTSSLALEGSVEPIRFAYEDVATWFHGQGCECTDAGADGFVDLKLKFSRPELVEALDDLADGERELTLTGMLTDGTPIVGTDCVIVKHSGQHRDVADIPSTTIQFVAEPNPFSRDIQLSYRLPEATQVHLSIYDMSGRRVTQLVDETQVPGLHFASWIPRGAASGIYFCRFKTDSIEETRRIVLLRTAE